MKTESISRLLSATILLLTFGLAPGASQSLGDYNALNEIGLTTKQLAELRGYIANDHYVTTKSGYILNVVEILNPLINYTLPDLVKKSVVLFVHGIVSNANGFLVNSIGAKPADYSSYNATTLGLDGLKKLLGNDSTINSLPLLLSNFGHKVIMFNRRGSRYSMGRTDGRNASSAPTPGENVTDRSILTNAFSSIVSEGNNTNGIFQNIVESFAKLIQASSEAANSDYWDYPFDPQAEEDFGDVLEKSMSITNRSKISVLGHSAGGAVPIMALAIQPELAEKVGVLVAWSPGLNQGRIPVEAFKIQLFQTFFNDYIGPVPPVFSVPIISSLAAGVCSTSITRHSICQLVSDALFGPDGIHQQLLPGFLIETIDKSSGYELAQIGQNVMFDGFTHFFSYGTDEQNLDRYGSTLAPPYNFSQITLERIHLYGAVTDELVSPQDVASLYGTLKAATFEVVSGSDGLFNHVGYLFNDNAGTVINLKSLIRFESIAE